MNWFPVPTFEILCRLLSLSAFSMAQYTLNSHRCELKLLQGIYASSIKLFNFHKITRVDSPHFKLPFKYLPFIWIILIQQSERIDRSITAVFLNLSIPGIDTYSATLNLRYITSVYHQYILFSYIYLVAESGVRP